ncbi:uncharacterized protein LOC127264998 isoform X2 [Andrographis paniculata]|uniref:uncharacterized protein LOC127264998 isoform X2 n=1 Tax=Andrographis paniculata TaxID=175694 RepID=UPI0021E9864C|nr:uncharacterized protein LOC127264998 isoform X2 [Andrographis paniculata]
MSRVLLDDQLYLNKEKFISFASNQLPLRREDEAILKKFLDLSKIIMDSQTTKERISKRSDFESNPVIQGHASSIYRKMISLQDGKTNYDAKTWEILESSSEMPLKTKGILTLISFAVMFGKLRLVIVANERDELAKNIVILQKQPYKQDTSDANWLNYISKVTNLTLKLAYKVMDLKENELNNNREQYNLVLSTAVYRIIRIMLICWAQVVQMLIKNNRKDVYTYLFELENWERTLGDKCQEIDTIIPVKEQPSDQTPKLNEESRLSLGPKDTRFWQKLCQIIYLRCDS